MAKKTKKVAKRRTPKRLSHTLYSYVEPTNGKWAREYGKKYFGSFSSYVDKLISLDRKFHFSKKEFAKKATKKTTAKRPKLVSVKTEETQQAAA